MRAVCMRVSVCVFMCMRVSVCVCLCICVCGWVSMFCRAAVESVPCVYPLLPSTSSLFVSSKLVVTSSCTFSSLPFVFHACFRLFSTILSPLKSTNKHINVRETETETDKHRERELELELFIGHRPLYKQKKNKKVE